MKLESLIHCFVIFIFLLLKKSYEKRCFICEAKECDSLNMAVGSCSSDESAACTTLVKDGVRKKGCLKADKIEDCKQNPHCSYCTASLCNTEGLSVLACYACGRNQQDDSNCPTETMKVHGCTGSGPTYKCASIQTNINGSSKTKRGCVNTAKKGFVQNCRQALDSGGKCMICHRHLCNSVEAGFDGGDPLNLPNPNAPSSATHYFFNAILGPLCLGGFYTILLLFFII